MSLTPLWNGVPLTSRERMELVASTSQDSGPMDPVRDPESVEIVTAFTSTDSTPLDVAVLYTPKRLKRAAVDP